MQRAAPMASEDAVSKYWSRLVRIDVIRAAGRDRELHRGDAAIHERERHVLHWLRHEPKLAQRRHLRRRRHGIEARDAARQLGAVVDREQTREARLCDGR